MLSLPEKAKVYICLEAIDMRKSINGLTFEISARFSEQLQSGSLFLFCNKHRDKVKGVFWHRNGFVMVYKRLEKGKFKVKFNQQAQQAMISEQQLSWLLAGLDYNLMNEFNELSYTDFY